jgi:hypothetical protein
MANQLWDSAERDFLSTNVLAFAYDPESFRLFLWFQNGWRYYYDAVPMHVFVGLKAAPSKGIYLDQFVKKAGYNYSPRF